MDSIITIQLDTEDDEIVETIRDGIEAFLSLIPTASVITTRIPSEIEDNEVGC